MARIHTVSFAAMLAVSCLPSSAGAQDTVICRGAGFYQTHSGAEKDGPNIAQEILEAADGIDVCGHHIVASDDLGGLDSALEGLCVRTQGEEERQLYRQLITAKFNCLMSEGGDCSDITSELLDVSYGECDSLCAGGPAIDPPTVEECIENLSCFNEGGRMIEGECATGTCNDDGVTNCEEDEDCGEDVECVRFEDSCASSQFCSEDLDSPVQICPKHGPATSPKTCKVARKNGCTVDDLSCYESCFEFEPCVAACEATPGCDPEVACDDRLACFNFCNSEGFGDGTPCGCESAWATFCGFLNQTEPEYTDCLLNYPTAEGNGFCTQCEENPFSCVD